MDRFRDPVELARVLGDALSGTGALYRQLAAALAGAVSDGALVAGDRLPSERDLARALHVSRATVVAAYDELRGRGVLESRQGSGSRIAAPADREPAAVTRRLRRGLSAATVRRFDDAPDGLISMRYALEPGDPRISSALADVVEEDLPSLLDEVGYLPRGLPALRQALADHHTGLGLPTSAEQVLVTTGTHQALALVSQLLLERGATVAVESPSWPGCFDTFSAVGARMVGVPTDEEGLRVDRLREMLVAEQVAALFVMPSFHNPTGTLMSARRRAEVARAAAEHGVPVVEDLAYATALTHDGPLPPPVAASASAGGRVLTAGSLSKTLWAGLRLGWVRASEQDVEELARLKAHADMGTPLLDQAVAARLVPDLAALAADRTAVARDRLAHAGALLRTHLPDWSWQAPAGGTALWIRLPGYDAGILAQVALRHGVEVTPGRETDPTGAWDDHLRLPFTFEPDLMTEVVRRLAAAVADLRRP
ncbi:aminotransferase-like domain-containing protein [Nocardioides nitrophenolicus]|uniref:aminotransferase-like domain-containing protein n=1 Tax=Nocardioides nitrophenolicus TaxID=60489 RepID=UPI001961BE29|nr:PLP-dependent aminotransferase family protein [Nocardioides nitrophenolicus]MBM7520451.1 DNA-binding transcriptional MocR family regulator [Nocardioides nitrophenolicus]